MSAVPKPRLTAAEYLAIERRAELRSEFFDGEMFAMAGATRKHTVVADNLGAKAHLCLEGGPCVVMLKDMRVKINATGLYTYPDLLIVCGNQEYEDDTEDTLLNPRVIFEVLSKSTELYDRGKKFEHYRRVTSVQEYVLVAQNEVRIERFGRQADGNWLLTVFDDINGVFTLNSVPEVKVKLADIYANVIRPVAESTPPPSRQPA